MRLSLKDYAWIAVTALSFPFLLILTTLYVKIDTAEKTYIHLRVDTLEARIDSLERNAK